MFQRIKHISAAILVALFMGGILWIVVPQSLSPGELVLPAGTPSPLNAASTQIQSRVNDPNDTPVYYTIFKFITGFIPVNTQEGA